mmetsp:Transcript_23721/g.72485  ORF Transcript_23721/g.72485 Transcript_23721/m.72485 type:complete len:397 (+) Transcript_23721:2581-3771(+)
MSVGVVEAGWSCEMAEPGSGALTPASPAALESTAPSANTAPSTIVRPLSTPRPRPSRVFAHLPPPPLPHPEGLAAPAVAVPARARLERRVCSLSKLARSIARGNRAQIAPSSPHSWARTSAEPSRCALSAQVPRCNRHSGTPPSPTPQASDDVQERSVPWAGFSVTPDVAGDGLDARPLTPVPTAGIALTPLPRLASTAQVGVRVGESDSAGSEHSAVMAWMAAARTIASGRPRSCASKAGSSDCCNCACAAALPSHNIATHKHNQNKTSPSEPDGADHNDVMSDRVGCAALPPAAYDAPVSPNKHDIPLGLSKDGGTVVLMASSSPRQQSALTGSLEPPRLLSSKSSPHSRRGARPDPCLEDPMGSDNSLISGAASPAPLLSLVIFIPRLGSNGD